MMQAKQEQFKPADRGQRRVQKIAGKNAGKKFGLITC